VALVGITRLRAKMKTDDSRRPFSCSEDAKVDDDEVVGPDVADTLDVDDGVIVEPVVMANMTAVGVASVDDGMGSVWVVPEDSGV
jgi:hypothetical protein